MKQRFARMELIGFFATIVLGVLLHFVYDWWGENPFVAVFAPVNESIWEHLKLLFFPYLLWTVLLYARFGNSLPNLLPAKAVGVILGMATILVFYYTYHGILGVELIVLDILSFVLSVFVAYRVSYALSLHIKNFSVVIRIVSGVGLALLILLFALWSFYPPKLPLFFDFSQGEYGIPSQGVFRNKLHGVLIR